LKRHKQHPHGNHERWLVSYADFVTLLFAFFVVMFAASQKNEAKQVSASVREALAHERLSDAISTALGHGKRRVDKSPVVPDPIPAQEPPPTTTAGLERQPADLTKSLAKLQQALDAELKSGKVQIRMDARGITVSLREAAFFDSGDSKVQVSSLPILEKIAAVVRDLPNSLRLEGHTDSKPIHNSRFRGNWDLSTARAIAMLELLRDRFEIPTGRMAVAGYAENVPADNNETEQGRAHNRRVDLVILSAEGMKSEPLATDLPAKPSR
jgi:chemotaxis protein MotB